MGQGVISRLVFQPPDSSYQKDHNLIWLHTTEGEVVPAFFIDRDARFTLLFSHGNAEDLGMIIQYFRELAQHLEVNVFAYEYSGYGQSTGSPTEKNVYADVEAAFAYLTEVIGIPWHQIVLYGRSLGSGPSIYLASKKAVRGVVLQSPLMSAYRVGFNLRFTLPGDMFANIDRVAKVLCPLYVIHGTKDEIVPLWHGQELWRNAADPFEPFWVEGGGHNNIELLARDPFFEKFSHFLKHLEETDPSVSA
uniref:AB hydrolase-1 domain-containing protein n=1 Tax=Chromera velia CCMP2878 TaxID=1169474 RepID=A0A0G4F166_9ALVE|eukprot:Cvel_14670.t1-p1 / transcript=Cvel_14670.t1 / gene=Cvel_14670 / organism=Chromera_velia_CCMP2878 / gene_product=Alpha/beta hydrolase domain-containing protein 17C, putative / transcript_product=Alpha/beta hydrolase domain-containing protein 17C, putative / location=Cvel_scaffold1052:489-4675(-) / protein_length=248 / sequence_SO=supercontig / SO=protein_coding / is_pseudo=false